MSSRKESVIALAIFPRSSCKQKKPRVKRGKMIKSSLTNRISIGIPLLERSTPTSSSLSSPPLATSRMWATVPVHHCWHLDTPSRNTVLGDPWLQAARIRRLSPSVTIVLWWQDSGSARMRKCALEKQVDWCSQKNWHKPLSAPESSIIIISLRQVITSSRGAHKVCVLSRMTVLQRRLELRYETASSLASGHWTGSGSDRQIFCLSTACLAWCSKGTALRLHTGTLGRLGFMACCVGNEQRLEKMVIRGPDLARHIAATTILRWKQKSIGAWSFAHSWTSRTACAEQGKRFSVPHSLSKWQMVSGEAKQVDHARLAMSVVPASLASYLHPPTSSDTEAFLDGAAGHRSATVRPWGSDQRDGIRYV